LTRLDGPPRAYALAIKLLSLRPRSEKELFQRLEGRFGREEADATLSRLKKEGYLDDLSFAGWWISQRTNFKPMGGIRLRQELLQHGVAPDVVKEALGLLAPGSELAAALEVARRKLPHLAGDRVEQRLGLFLARRGFGRSVIDSVLRTLREQDGDFY